MRRRPCGHLDGWTRLRAAIQALDAGGDVAEPTLFRRDGLVLLERLVAATETLEHVPQLEGDGAARLGAQLRQL